LDKILVPLASLFPLDAILLAVLVLPFIFAVMAGIKDFPAPKSFPKLVSGHSTPSAIAVAAFLAAPAIFSLLPLFASSAPYYAAFGGLKGRDGKTCTIQKAAENLCRMTQSSKIFATSAGANQNFFGLVLLCLAALFVICCFVMAPFAAVKSVRGEKHSDLEERLIDASSEESALLPSRYGHED